jgi:hypothetical protein
MQTYNIFFIPVIKARKKIETNPVSGFFTLKGIDERPILSMLLFWNLVIAFQSLN